MAALLVSISVGHREPALFLRLRFLLRFVCALSSLRIRLALWSHCSFLTSDTFAQFALSFLSLPLTSPALQLCVAVSATLGLILRGSWRRCEISLPLP
jgi:hypothetical protein